MKSNIVKFGIFACVLLFGFTAADKAFAEVEVGTEAELIAAVENAGEYGETIVVTGQIQLAQTLVIPENRHITLCSGVLIGADGYDVIEIATHGSLTIEGSEIKHAPGDKGRGVYIREGAFMEMTSGSIRNNSVDGDGAGIYSEGYISIIPYDTDKTVFIQNNTATGNGGGIYLARTA
ncbi:MAG TPA: hypothetical protein DEB24_05860, partial [Coriobacteriia bacterium]|nr:hypothetical protein [Coriobacteriia bacterium]